MEDFVITELGKLSPIFLFAVFGVVMVGIVIFYIRNNTHPKSSVYTKDECKENFAPLNKVNELNNKIDELSKDNSNLKHELRLKFEEIKNENKSNHLEVREDIRNLTTMVVQKWSH